MIALMLAVIFRFVGVQHWSQHDLIDVVYSAAKFGMSFSGMCVLGMWLRHTKVEKRTCGKVVGQLC